MSPLFVLVMLSGVDVYGYPVSTAALAGRGAFEGEWGLDVPLGARFQVTEQTGIDVELSWTGLGLSGERDLRGWAASIAAGPSLKVWRGLWVDAHARFTLYHSVRAFSCPRGAFCAFDNGPGDLGPGRTRAFTAEVDVGYEWRWGALYFSPAIGVGGGYAFDYIDPTGVRLLSPFSTRTTQFNRQDGFVWTLNLKLLRVGVTF